MIAREGLLRMPDRIRATIMTDCGCPSQKLFFRSRKTQVLKAALKNIRIHAKCFHRSIHTEKGDRQVSIKTGNSLVR